MIQDEDRIDFTEAIEVSWREYLTEFKEKVFPVFEKHGFTLAQAFDAWEMNKIQNKLFAILNHMGIEDE